MDTLMKPCIMHEGYLPVPQSKGRPLLLCCLHEKHLQLRVRGEAKAWSADRTSTHPLLEACTVSAQGARQRRLLREAAVLLPQLAYLRVLPGCRPAQLLDLGHLRTACTQTAESLPNCPNSALVSGTLYIPSSRRDAKSPPAAGAPLRPAWTSCPAQLLDLGHLRTTCSPSHAALEADRRSLARVAGLRAAIELSLLC